MGCVKEKQVEVDGAEDVHPSNIREGRCDTLRFKGRKNV